MARRRYLSTDISKDTRVNRLAVEYGDFAALLYTWLIPHAADDAGLPADPEELLYLVMPGRRDKGIGDVESAISAMVDLGLLQRGDNLLRFPPSFFRYQSYVSEQRRQVAAGSVPSGLEQRQHRAEGAVGPVPAGKEESAQKSAEQRGPAQNRSSFSSSFSSSFPVSSSFEGDDAADAAQPPPPQDEQAKRKTELTPEFIEAMVLEFARLLGGEGRTREIVKDALAHKNRNKWSDKQQYLRGWLRRETERHPIQERTNGNQTRHGDAGRGGAAGAGPDVDLYRAQEARDRERQAAYAAGPGPHPPAATP